MTQTKQVSVGAMRAARAIFPHIVEATAIALAEIIDRETHAAELLEALEAALALFDKDHALSRFNWGTSGLRAEDIRELNELPGQLVAAIRKAKERT